MKRAVRVTLVLLICCSIVTTLVAKESSLETQLKGELAKKSFRLVIPLLAYTIEYDKEISSYAPCAVGINFGEPGRRWGVDSVISPQATVTKEVHNPNQIGREITLPESSTVTVKNVKIRDDRVELPLASSEDNECSENARIIVRLGKSFETRYSYDDIMRLIAGVVNIPRYTEPLQLESAYRDKKTDVERRITAYPESGGTEQQLYAAIAIHDELLVMLANRQRLAEITGRNVPAVDTVSKQSLEWSGTEARLRQQFAAEQQEAKRASELKAAEEARLEAERIAKAKEREQKATAASKQREALLREAANKSGWKLDALKLLSERIYPGASLSAAGGGWIRVNQRKGGVNFLVRDELGTGPLFLLVVSCYNGDPILGLFDGVDSPGSLVQVSALYGQQEEKGLWRMGPNYMLIPDNPKGTAFRALTGHMFSLVRSGVWSAMFDTNGLPYSTVEKVCRNVQ